MAFGRLPSNVRIVDDNGLPTPDLLRNWNALWARVGGGAENPPSVPQNLVYSINIGGVLVSCDENPAAESITGYQWRLGATWETGVMLQPLGPNSITIPSDQAGTYLVWVAAADVRGNFSAGASIEVTVTDADLGLYGPEVTLATDGMAFVNLKNGSGLTPASIVVTALTLNLPGGVYAWKVDGVLQVGEVNPTFSLAAFAAGSSKVVRCDVTSGALTAFDVFTIYSVNEGDDAITAGLSNENQSILVDSGGTAVAGLPAGGTMTVARGAVVLSSGVVYSLVSNVGCTASINSSTGVYSVTAISADSATATFRATVTVTSTVIDKVMTLNKSYPGADAPLLALTGTGFAFAFTDASSTTSGSPTITLTAGLTNVTGTATFVATAYNASNTSLGTITLGGSGNTRTLTAAQFVSLGATTTRYITTVATLGSLTDTFTIYRGDGGTNAINGFLTNEAQLVPASAAGVVSSFTGAGGTFKIFQGLADQTTAASFSVQSNPDSVTTTIGAATGIYSVTAAGSWASGTNTTTVTYRATFGGATIDKVFTITKSLIGATGSTGSTGAAGARGSLKGYGSQYSISDSSWSDGHANRVISNMLTGASLTTSLASTALNVLGDTVQETNGTTFTGTKFWSGSAWISAGTIIDGNVLVNGTGLFTGDLVVGGLATFDGSNTAAGNTWALTANVAGGSYGGVFASTNSGICMYAIGFATGSTGVVASGYKYGIQASGGTDTNSVGGDFSTGGGTGAVAVRMLGSLGWYNAAGSTLYKWVPPDGTATKFMAADGSWTNLATQVKLVSSANPTAGSALGYLIIDTLGGAGQVKVPYYAV